MIKNLNLTLVRKENKRLWVDTDKVSDITLKRLFLSLRSSNSLYEQHNLLGKISAQEGYNPLAEETMLYRQDNNIVQIMKCKYDSETNTYTKGEVLRTIELNN